MTPARSARYFIVTNLQLLIWSRIAIRAIRRDKTVKILRTGEGGAKMKKWNRNQCRPVAPMSRMTSRAKSERASEFWGKGRRRRDFLLVVIPTLTAIIMGGAVSFGLSPKLVLIPSLVLLVWPIYLLTEKFSEDQQEMAFLQSIRATEYFVGLIVMIPVNGAIVATVNLLAVFLTLPATAVLTYVTALVARSVRAEVRLFSEAERSQLDKVLREAGVAVIWLSTAIAFDDLTLSASPNVLGLTLAALVSLAFGYIAMRNEARSTRFAALLSESLGRSRWANRVQFQKRRRGKP